MKKIKLNWSTTNLPNIYTLRYAVSMGKRMLARQILTERLGATEAEHHTQGTPWDKLVARVEAMDRREGVGRRG